MKYESSFFQNISWKDITLSIVFEILSSKKQTILRKLYIFIKHINKVIVLMACQLLSRNPFILLSVYIVNSLLAFYFFCYLSLYQCIWLYKNKNIELLILFNKKNPNFIVWFLDQWNQRKYTASSIILPSCTHVNIIFF